MKKNNKIEQTLCCRHGWLEEKKKDDLVKREQNQSNRSKQKMKERERQDINIVYYFFNVGSILIASEVEKEGGTDNLLSGVTK